MKPTSAIAAIVCLWLVGASEAHAGAGMELRYDPNGERLLVTDSGQRPAPQALKLTRRGDTFILANPPAGFMSRGPAAELCDLGAHRASCPVNRILRISIRLGGGSDAALVKVTPSGRVRISVAGQGGADRIKATVGQQRLHGGTGDDTLRGGPGRDVIVGGADQDSCRGGPARDVIRACE
jgi:hypothetical protein